MTDIGRRGYIVSVSQASYVLFTPRGGGWFLLHWNYFLNWFQCGCNRDKIGPVYFVCCFQYILVDHSRFIILTFVKVSSTTYSCAKLLMNPYIVWGTKKHLLKPIFVKLFILKKSQIHTAFVSRFQKFSKVVGFGVVAFSFFLNRSQFEECGRDVQNSTVAMSLLKAQNKFRCTNMVQFL